MHRRDWCIEFQKPPLLYCTLVALTATRCVYFRDKLDDMAQIGEGAVMTAKWIMS